MNPNQEQKHKGSGDKIEYHFHGKKVLVPRYLTGLPSLEDELIGREEELAELQRTLHTAQSVVLMNGMGGIGKTTLALAYANLHKDAYRHIAWVEVPGDFATGLTSHFILLQNLSIKELTGSPKGDVLLVLNELAKLGGTNLLILDDANDTLKTYKAYLPKDWHVLLTSRQELGFRHTLRLDFLSADSARKLFYSHYTWEQDDTTVNAILAYVGYHTLSVELLAKTAQRRRIKRIAELRAALEERGLEIGRVADFSTLHSRDQNVERIFPYLKVVFKIDEDKLTDTERRWLRRLAMLPPSFTEVEDLARFFEIDKKDIDSWDSYTATLESLHAKGWLIYDDKDDAYKMHQIIREVVRYYLPSVENELDTLVNIMSNLGEIYRESGEYERARDLLEKALQSVLSFFGKDHPNALFGQSNLASVYQNLGDYHRARELLEKALDNALKNFDEWHPRVAISQSNLANVYRSLGQYEKAQDLFEKALASNLKNFGEVHPTVAVSQSNLANVYYYLGEYERARDLLEKTLASNLKNFGEVHPTVASYQSNLGWVYKELGEYERARDLLEKALQNALKNFGELHPKVAVSYDNLIEVYAYFKQWDKAQEASNKSLDIWLKTLGVEHPYTKRAKEWQAWLQQQMEQDGQA